MADELTLGDQDAMGEMDTETAFHLEMRFGPGWKELTVREAIELLAAYSAEGEQAQAAREEAEAELEALDAEIAAFEAEHPELRT